MSEFLGKSIGRYHILEQLGQGGMATVFKAYDTRLERDVAIKVIRKETFPAEVHERVLKRFEREAKALAKMSHVNIVKIHDFGEYEGAPYLVMELQSGGTLKDIIDQPVSYSKAIQIIIPVAQALAYAHRYGVLHRDVKPGNILITESGEPILTDFGIAKLLESEEGQTLTGTGVGMGTPEYMAPEQGLGKQVDERADVYALGVVFYELITGHKPFVADTPMAVIIKQINDPLPRPKNHISDIPSAVEKVLFKALAKDPNDRYQNMNEFENALGKLLGSKYDKKLVAISSKKLKGDNFVGSEQTIDNLLDLDLSSKNNVFGKNDSGKQRFNINVKRKRIWIIGFAGLILLSTSIYFVGKQITSSKQQTERELLVTNDIQPTDNSILLTPTKITTVTSEPITDSVDVVSWIEGEEIFYDDFEDGSTAGWSFDGFWNVIEDESGNYVLQREGSSYSEAKIVNSNNWKNYSFEARVKILQPSTEIYGETFDLLIRIQDSKRYKWIINETFLNFGREPGWTQFQTNNFSYPMNTWFTVRVEVMGDKFRGYIDDEQFFEVIDNNPLLFGGVGFSVIEDVKIQFDDVSIVELIQTESKNLSNDRTTEASINSVNLSPPIDVPLYDSFDSLSPDLSKWSEPAWGNPTSFMPFQENGELIMENSPGSWRDWAISGNRPIYAMYALVAIDDTTDGAIGISLRNDYRYELIITNRNLVINHDGIWESMHVGNTSKYCCLSQHLLGAICDEDNIYFYIDGEFVESFHITEYPNYGGLQILGDGQFSSHVYDVWVKFEK